ncbi:DUF2797 domain-containing protein [Alicyclobacillus mengziensis]|uniref:DUF2797 domain-containing protein n=1 Tax=Alicyclobacillus mengziensis TaxID=2931921 RepID=A0A9X7VWA1_9BACL|nr:DUF2797 domain-containing protein [Alicyclobacillus mengziensis]QSO45765.1 DUF2797 domain-containing protein [Alicyclobacillus mengziensis]
MADLTGFLNELHNEAVTTEDTRHRVEYAFSVGDEELSLSSLLGNSVEIRFTGQKSCIHCGRKVKKLYQNGYCFPCVTTLAECDLCIVKPHECHYHQGTCRDNSFADTHCMIPHYVYLADSSTVKVGLTRKGRQLKRWTDQGATSAVLFAQTPTRKTAGELEMHIAQYLPDKTDWRKMLRDTGEQDADLLAVRQQLMSMLDTAYAGFVLPDQGPVYRFEYPRLQGFEPNLKSLSLDKEPIVSGRLCAMKGQYLMFEHGVLNVKKHAGFHVEVSICSTVS